MLLSTLLSFAADTLYSYLRSMSSAIGGFISDIYNPETILPTFRKRKESGEIWNFLSHFKSGIAKSCRYRIEFNLPKGCAGSNVNDVNQYSRSGYIASANKTYNKNGSIGIKAHTVTFPQRAFQTFEIKHNSAPFKIPLTSSYDPVTFTFYNDSELDVRRYFDIWQGAIINFSNNTSNFYNEYTSDVKMYIQDDLGEDVYGITLFEAYPMGISLIDMSYSSVNQYMNMSTTFSYKYWLPMDSTQRINRSA